MSIDEIKNDIAKLSDEDRAKLRAWWDELEAAAWDRQIERDIKAGKFNKLAAEALAEFKAGRTKKI